MTTRKHYHVSVNMAGYMPDGDPEVYTTKAAAVAAGIWHKEQFQESGDLVGDKWVPEYAVRGSARLGGYVVERNGDNRYALPTYINVDVHPCRDASCAEWFDEDGEVIEY